MFYTVRLRKENRKDRKLGRKFSLLCSLFYPPKSGEKCGEKSAVKALLHKYTLSPTPHSWPNDFCPQIILITFASSHPYLHSTPMSRFSSLSLSLSLFFFFFSTWPDQVDTFYCFLSSLYSTLILLNSSLLTTFLWAECSFSICPGAFMSWPLAGYKIFCPIKFICTLL